MKYVSLEGFLLTLLYEAIRRIFRGSVKGLLILFVGFNLSACLESGGGGEAASLPVAPEVPGTPIVVTLKSGSGFTCFQLDLSDRSQIYCKGPASDVRLGITSAAYSLYVEDSDSDITALEVWDNTVCWSTWVQQSPFLREPNKLAVYCTGHATIGPNYTGYQYTVFGGAQFTTAANGSSDLWYAEEPFIGGEWNFTIGVMMNPAALVMQDTSVTVTESDITCDLSADETSLTCPTFTLEVQ